MTPLGRMKLTLLQERYGPMSSSRALERALVAEQTCEQLGPFDAAFPFFKRQQGDMESYAGLLEQAEQSTCGELS